MKTLSTIFLIFSITFIKAQTNPATPNANFEDWTHFSAGGGYDDPDSWNCLNPLTSGLGFFTCFKDSGTVLSGKYSVLLVTRTFGSQLIPGTLTTGTIDPNNQTINGGIPYGQRPDSIIGWYQYAPVSGDNGDIEFYLFGSNHTDTIGQAFFKTPVTNVHSWTRFSLPIIYSGSASPDTALWIITSSDNQVSGHAGSQLIVDSLGLVFNQLGVTTINNSENISIWPNPTNGLISINANFASQTAIFTLYDITGREVGEGKLAKGTTDMDLTGMPAGIYLYTIQNEDNPVIKTGKIILEK